MHIYRNAGKPSTALCHIPLLFISHILHALLCLVMSLLWHHIQIMTHVILCLSVTCSLVSSAHSLSLFPEDAEGQGSTDSMLLSGKRLFYVSFYAIIEK